MSGGCGEVSRIGETAQLLAGRGVSGTIFVKFMASLTGVSGNPSHSSATFMFPKASGNDRLLLMYFAGRLPQVIFTATIVCGAFSVYFSRNEMTTTLRYE
jgi:hypothetical protein